MNGDLHKAASETGGWLAHAGFVIITDGLGEELQGLKRLKATEKGIETGTNVFTHSYEYAPRVRMRALEDPVSHNFLYSFDDAILNTNAIPKNNGYQIFQLKGTMNGKNGFFEIGLTKDGIIDHRFFRPVY